jgi:hypothetical protein
VRTRAGGLVPRVRARKELFMARDTLVRRPCAGSRMLVEETLRVLVKRARDRDHRVSLEDFVLANPPPRLSLGAIKKILAASRQTEWFGPKLVADQSRQVGDRFVHHHYSAGLLDRRGFKNTGYEYRWILLEEFE